MTLRIYNTLSKKVENFQPIEKGKVKIYLCGPTVYDLLHIGNFRGAITFNLIRNWLEHLSYDVTMVYNYTDVDDKIIKKSIDEGVSSKVVSERYIREFEKDFKSLGLRAHDHNPKVTEFIPQIIKFIEELVNNKHAYEVEGEVFYSVKKYKKYGQLSGKKLDQLEAGRRVEVDQKKKDPFDFVLWKPSKENEPAWDSPWGKGRPGWHIECSAMIDSILGEQIDIHGGGIDLIHPHHENEIAQSEGKTGKKFCNYWCHNNFISMGDEKMSKSLGNVVTGRAFIEKYHPEVLKFVFLSSHYRSQLSVGSEQISGAIVGLARIYSALKDATTIVDKVQNEDGVVDKEFIAKMNECENKIEFSMNDDFNSGEMVSAIFEVVRFFNSLEVMKKPEKNKRASSKAFLTWMHKFGKMMALFCEKPSEFLQKLDDIYLIEKKLTREEIDDLVNQRKLARAGKDFKKSDELRAKLDELGIVVKDDGNESVWEMKK